MHPSQGNVQRAWLQLFDDLMKMPSDRSKRACRSNQEPNFRVAWARHHKSPMASTRRAQSSRPQTKLATTLPRITTCPGADIWTTSRRTPHRMRGSSGCGCVEYAMRRSFLRCADCTTQQSRLHPPATSSHLLPPPHSTSSTTTHLLPPLPAGTCKSLGRDPRLLCWNKCMFVHKI